MVVASVFFEMRFTPNTLISTGVKNGLIQIMTIMENSCCTEQTALITMRVTEERSADRSNVSPMVSQPCQSTVGSTLASTRFQSSSHHVASDVLELFVDALIIMFKLFVINYLFIKRWRKEHGHWR